MQGVEIFMMMLYYPLICGVREGAIEIFELLLIVVGFVFLKEQKDAKSGVMLGLASMCKFLPIIFMPYLVMKRKWKAFWCMLATVVFIACTTQVLLGWQNNETITRMSQELKARNYAYTYFRSQSAASFVARTLCVKDYSIDRMISARVENRELVDVVSKILVVVLSFFAFVKLRKNNSLLHDVSIILCLMGMIVTHGEPYYLVFNIPGLYFLKKNDNPMFWVSFILCGPLYLYYHIAGEVVTYSYLSLPFIGTAILFFALLYGRTFYADNHRP